MKHYLLDTNTVSHILKAHPLVTQRLLLVPITSLCISVVTEAELRFGLARRPDATRLRDLVQRFLTRVDILPWDSSVAACYGNLRNDLERNGKTLAPLDLMIAAHALATNRVLVTSDTAFLQMESITIEDWTHQG